MLKIWIELQIFYVCPDLEWVPLTSKNDARQIKISQMRLFDLKTQVILAYNLPSFEFSGIAHLLSSWIETLFVMQSEGYPENVRKPSDRERLKHVGFGSRRCVVPSNTGDDSTWVLDSISRPK